MVLWYNKVQVKKISFLFRISFWIYAMNYKCGMVHLRKFRVRQQSTLPIQPFFGKGTLVNEGNLL